MFTSLQKGFTLIELMIVIAIVGILSAIALPAFQDYMVRARVSEVVLAASALRSDISEFAHTNGQMPSTGAVTPPPTGSRWVSGVTYQGETASTGVVTAMATGDPKIASATITMRGELRDNGQVDWICSGTITARYRPASCR